MLIKSSVMHKKGNNVCFRFCMYNNSTQHNAHTRTIFVFEKEVDLQRVKKHLSSN